MDKLIAYCGLDCAACDARKATLNNDDALRAEVAKKWAVEFKFPFTQEMINCTGCKAEGVKIGHCSECEIRSCGMTMKVENCGACSKYATCKTIGDFIAMAPFVKETLDSYSRAKA